MNQQTKLLRSSDVRARYNGISDRTLCRWERDPDMGFPRPLIINKRKYWDEFELDAFDAAQARGNSRRVPDRDGTAANQQSHIP